jgi:hypothetical protein
MAGGQIRLGTSSWTGDGWVGSFYPANARPQEFLPIGAGLPALWKLVEGRVTIAL